MVLLGMMPHESIQWDYKVKFGEEKCTGTNCSGYKGRQNKTKSGKICTNWTAQNNNNAENVLGDIIKDGLVGNYCRFSENYNQMSLIKSNTSNAPQKKMKTIHCGYEVVKGQYLFEECEPLAKVPENAQPAYYTCEETRSQYNAMTAEEKEQFTELLKKSRESVIPQSMEDPCQLAYKAYDQKGGVGSHFRPDTGKCNAADFDAIDPAVDENKCIIGLQYHSTHCPLETGCETVWDQAKNEGVDLSLSGAADGTIASGESSVGIKTGSSSSSSSVKGRQAYGTTYCSFYEVTLGENYKDDDDDFNCKGPKTFTTCGKDCSNLVKCKDMEAQECNSTFLSLTTAFIAITIAA